MAGREGLFGGFIRMYGREGGVIWWIHKDVWQGGRVYLVDGVHIKNVWHEAVTAADWRHSAYQYCQY